MHYIFTGLGSYGDVLPMVGLGTTLAERGHQVTLISNPYFEGLIRDAGLQFLPLGTRQDYLSLIHHPLLWHPTRGSLFVLQYGCEKFLRPLYELLAQHIIPGETILAAHGLDMASRIAAEKLDVPIAGVHFAPAVFMSTYQSTRLPRGFWGDGVPRWLKAAQFWLAERLIADPIVAKPVNDLREELDLPPVQRILSTWWHKADELICMFPEWFAPVQPDWPTGAKLVGFPHWDARPDDPLSPEVEDFLSAGEAPIVFAPGSGNATAESFFAEAVKACQQVGRRGILLTKFPEQIPADLPEEVKHFSFVPLSQLLPRASAFVHHGGIGSTSQGLAAGIPHIVRPMAHDQFDNSIRLQRLGVGTEVAVKEFTGPRVATSLEKMLTSNSVAKSCQEFAAQCDGKSALANACDALETLGGKELAR